MIAGCITTIAIVVSIFTVATIVCGLVADLINHL